jgi:hypothetical protein
MIETPQIATVSPRENVASRRRKTTPFDRRNPEIPSGGERAVARFPDLSTAPTVGF